MRRPQIEVFLYWVVLALLFMAVIAFLFEPVMAQEATETPTPEPTEVPTEVPTETPTPTPELEDPYATPLPPAVAWRLTGCTITYPEDPYTPYAFFGYWVDPAGLPGGYAASFVDVQGTVINPLFGDFPIYFYPGDHPEIWGIPVPDGQYATWIVTLFGQTKSITISARSRICGQSDGTGEPDGPTENITVYNPPCNPCAWEIQDEYGNWHEIGVYTPVQEEDGQVFTRLVLAADNPVTDAGRYRVHP